MMNIKINGVKVHGNLINEKLTVFLPSGTVIQCTI
jgi:hypothetical protein